MKKRIRLSICAIFAAIAIAFAIGASVAYHTFDNLKVGFILAAVMILAFVISGFSYNAEKANYKQTIFFFCTIMVVICVCADCIQNWI